MVAGCIPSCTRQLGHRHCGRSGPDHLERCCRRATRPGVDGQALHHRLCPQRARQRCAACHACRRRGTPRPDDRSVGRILGARVERRCHPGTGRGLWSVALRPCEPDAGAGDPPYHGAVRGQELGRRGGRDLADRMGFAPSWPPLRPAHRAGDAARERGVVHGASRRQGGAARPADRRSTRRSRQPAQDHGHDRCRTAVPPPLHCPGRRVLAHQRHPWRAGGCPAVRGHCQQAEGRAPGRMGFGARPRRYRVGPEGSARPAYRRIGPGAGRSDIAAARLGGE